MSEQAKILSPNVVLAMMALAALAAVRALLPIEGPPDSDFALFLYPWMDVIRERGLASIAGGFSEYTPPYIYLLNVAVFLEPAVGTLAAIKLVNLPFVIACAFGIGAIVREVSGDKALGTTAAAVGIVCPSLLINAFAFGQCDAIFTGFLLWFVYFAMREKPALACLMFGLAVSFKAQAMFLAPLLLALWLCGRIGLRHALLIPATYAALMLPAAIAGRPWTELLTVYVRQSDVMHELSLNAPNPWWFLRHLMDYPVGLAVGLAAGVAATALIAWRAKRLRPDAFTILLVATVAAAVLPWVLPKMTARYFIVADLLTIALAFARPRLWFVAVLVQVGSVIAIVSDFFVPWGTASVAFGPITLGVAVLAFELFRTGDMQRRETRA
ncbi:MAG TPA: hypothetical protein VJM15_05190 [Sphingomicrobium sp.]|nr:hypothetical protein [Sphingomicrobium sp.]